MARSYTTSWDTTASPRSVVMVLSGGRKRRLSRSVWRVAPVVATQVLRDI